ncbi:MAG: glucose-1-phosphate cytidylyltransferase [archaeon]
MKDLQAVILCGGKGTRLREETEYKPKPMVPIGGMPILWHIMKTYSNYGVRRFVLCLGYKGEMIKEYFMNFGWMSNDFSLKTQSKMEYVTHKDLEDWEIVFADTGIETPTGGRIKKIEKHIDGDNFFATYGDGVSNINITTLRDHHVKMGKIGTLTAVHPTSQFGVVELENGLVKSFKQKPRLEGIINGGFFAFKTDFFDYVKEESVLEEDPLLSLVKKRQLAAYHHTDFWHCMDTFKDVTALNQMWDSGNRPWVVWK